MATKAEIMANNNQVKLEKKKDPAIKWLEDNLGCAKDRPELSEKETRRIREKVAREMTPEKSRKIAKEFGFE